MQHGAAVGHLEMAYLTSLVDIRVKIVIGAGFGNINTCCAKMLSFSFDDKNRTG